MSLDIGQSLPLSQMSCLAWEHLFRIRMRFFMLFTSSIGNGSQSLIELFISPKIKCDASLLPGKNVYHVYISNYIKDLSLKYIVLFIYLFEMKV